MYDLIELIKENNINKDNITDYIPQIAAFLSKGDTYQVLVHLKHLFDIDFDQLIGYCAEQKISINYNSVVSRLISINRKDIVEKYSYYFISNNPKLFILKQIFIENNMDIDSIKRYIRYHPDCIIKEMLLNCDKDIDKLKEEKVYDVLKELINELLLNEEVDIDDIEYIGNGAITTVYAIGNKVLKIGRKRPDFKMDNHRFFLKPLLRKELYSKDNEFLCCLEIVEKINTNNISKEDVYYIYKNLRDDGLIWLDTYKANVGRLIRDNDIYFDGIDKVSINSTGYNNDNDEVLNKGDLVLVDNEYIYDYETSKNLPFVIDHLNTNEYAIRYEQEQLNNDYRI